MCKWLRDPRFNVPPEDGLNGSFLPLEVVVALPFIDPAAIDAPVIGSKALGSQVEIVLPTVSMPT